MTAIVARAFAGSPWGVRQARLLTALNALALVLLLVVWRTSLNEESVRDQTAWLTLGVIAVVIAAAADVSWLATGRRAVLLRRRRIIADTIEPAVAEASAGPGATGWVTIDGASRAHRPGCILLAGKPAVTVDPAKLRAVGRDLRRCEVCAR